MSDAAEEPREDRLFGGRLRLLQGAKGHRAGTDAVLLVAAAGRAGLVGDLGAGIGTIGLGLAALGRAERVVLVERDGDAAALARANIALNGLQHKASVIEADVTARASTLTGLGLGPASLELIVANPPYNDPDRHRASPDPARFAAHAMSEEAMSAWIRTAARLLKGDGRLVLLHRPDALPWLLPLLRRSFGGLGMLPVHPHVDEPARRVLIGGRLHARAPARLLPALVLHERGGGFTPLAAALHRGEAELAL